MFFKLKIPGRSYDIASKTKSVQVDNASTKKDLNTPEKCSVGQRHAVAVMGFVLLSLISAHLSAVGVSIVAMVKHAEINETLFDEDSEIVCPELSTEANSTSLTKHVREGDFDWSPQIQGCILGTAMLGFTLTQVVGGTMAEKWGAKRVLFTGTFLSGLFTTISPFIAWCNVYFLIVVQFARGMSQGVVLSGVYVMLANWSPRCERSLLSTFVNSGYSFGSAVGGALSGWWCDIPQLGWPASFYIIGGFTIFFSIVFLLVFYETPKHHPRITMEELNFISGDQEMDVSKERPPVPWKKMFTSVPVYALIIGNFGYAWSLSYFVIMHPTYMGRVLHYSMSSNGVVSCLPHLIRTAVGVFGSLITNQLQKHLNVSVLRKGCNSVGAFGYCLCMLGVIWASCDLVANNVFFILALVFSGVYISGSLIVVVDMSPRFPGSLSGIAIAIPAVGAAMLPILVGALTKHGTLVEWHEVFYICIALVFCSGVIFLLFGSAEVQPWNFSDDENEKNKTEAYNKAKLESKTTDEEGRKKIEKNH